MRNVATLAVFAAGTNALIPRQNSCCFHLTASGEVSGYVGQLGDGQNRIGGNLPEGLFCIASDGSITDGSGRSCILTPPTTQFQCDLGGAPMPGFSVNSNGQLVYDESPEFVACETGDNGALNIYTTESSDVTNCRSVYLNADGCWGTVPQPGGTSPVASPSPGVPGGVPSQPGTTPGVSPGAPGGVPGQPGTTPGVSPGAPGGVPGQPGTTPGVPGGVPGQPGTTPGVSPGVPGQPGTTPGVPGGVPGQGGACEGCAVATVYTTVTVPCASETPGVPGIIPGEPGTPGVPPGETPGASQPPTGGIPTQPTGSPVPSQPPSGVPPGQPSGPPGASQPPSGGTPTQPSQPPSTVTQQPCQSCCPTDLSGEYEYPQLIIPVDSSSPNTAAGSQYNGSVSSTVSTVFNFDIPAKDAGKTCTLVFLFPNQDDLETSSFSFSGDGAVQFGGLESPASQSTTYNNAPSVIQDYGVFTINPGHSYSICSFECPAGQTIGFEMTNAGSTNLEYVQDYKQSPIGLYITTC